MATESAKIAAKATLIRASVRCKSDLPAFGISAIKEPAS
jgi:hypothetical protein